VVAGALAEEIAPKKQKYPEMLAMTI